MAASVVTVPSGTVNFSDEQIGELGMQFRGSVCSPGDPEYDDLRMVENLAIDRRPGLIVRCSGEADVIDGVNLAREHHLAPRRPLLAGTTSRAMAPSTAASSSTCAT